MRYKIALAILGMAFLGIPPAVGQQTEAPSANRVLIQGPGPGAVPKRLECRQRLRAQGFRGEELRNQVGVCAAAARLDCAKQAAQRNISRFDRRAFMDSCMGR
jgi:hypothetical protein